MTDSGSASRRSLLGLGGLASLCCLGPAVAVTGGGATAGALTGGLVEFAVTAVTLALLAVVLRRHTRCRACEE